MKYEVYYVLDVFEYEWVDGTRGVDPLNEMNVSSGMWELTEETYNAEHLNGLMRDVFNRFAPYGNEILDRSPSYVIEDLIAEADGKYVMVEYDMCLTVSVDEEVDVSCGSADLVDVGFNFAKY